MYNKLFTKILDSSIWLEPMPTRIVWITLIAAMDEDGYAHFSAVENLASRARVTVTECNEAIATLSNPDKNSADSENEGRRIERVPGGFIVLNAGKYREMASRATARESTRKRVQRYREKSGSNGSVTACNAVKRSVTQSEAYTHSDTEADANTEADAKNKDPQRELIQGTSEIEIYEAYPKKVSRPEALKAIGKALRKKSPDDLLALTRRFAEAVNGSDKQFIPHPATWFNQERFNDDPETWRMRPGARVGKPRQIVATEQDHRNGF